MTVTANDGRGGTGSATFSWTIAAANVAPVVTNPGSQSGTVGVAVTALQIVATDGNGDALTYSATGLPAGLSISASGLITGTPSAAGTSSVTVTANDGRGGTGSATFSWTIAAANVAPVVTNPGSQSGTVGVAVTALQIVATDGNGDALTYSATGLPAGLSISASGLITGTPSAAGTSSVTVTANDGRGGTGSATFSWTIAAANVAPVVTNPGSQSGTVGVAVTALQIVATDGNGDALTYSATGLPAGLSISASGLITGTPSAAGTSSVTVTANDGRGGTGSATFSWTIAAANVAPVVTNPGSQSGTVGVAVTALQIVATDGNGDALTYSATGLPAGLSISASGLITGTPSAAGTSSVTVTANDGRGGTGSATFSWTIAAANVAPVVTNPGSQSGTVGVAVTALQIVATDGNGDALTYSATGLPAGLSISASGLITGTPSAAGTSSVTVTANDGRGGTGSATFSWTIAAANVAPVVTNPGSQSGTVGVAVTALQIVATDGNGDALTYSATGLPAGLSISASGLITGTPSAAGTSSVTVTANDGRGGTGSATFSWTIAAANVAPVVTNPGSQSGTVGVAVTALQIVATDGNGDALTYSATGLPAGLSISASGLITGTPSAAGTSSVTVTANDGRGGTGSATFSWTIAAANVAPVVTNPGSQSGTVGVAVTALQIVATDGNGDALTYSATGLPAGLSISASGLITGTPSAAGTSSVTVTANDGRGGTGSATFSWTIAAANVVCPCSAWDAGAVPLVAAATDTGAVELGVKFRSTVGGYVTGIRFYKGTGNTGTHTGSLWTTSGTRLATATFSNESASGWQQVNFAAPVPIAANTVYVASYFAPAGGYSYDRDYFSTAGAMRGPLYLLRDGESGGNGLYAYGSGGQFPSSTYQSTNYWVDVVFVTSANGNVAPVVTNPGSQSGTVGVAVTALQIVATDGNGDALTYSATGLPAGLSISASGLITGTPSAAGTSSVTVTANDGRGGTGSATFSWTIAAANVVCPCSAWDAGAVPLVAAATDTGAVELGVKFRSTVGGYVTGIRFYKGTGNTGTHTGSLWTTSGTRLATATFSNESASGWQQVNFAAPVPIAANTVYVASYFAPAGGYSYDRDYFSTAGAMRGPLYLLRDGESGGNGLYAYGSGGQFPSSTYQSTNYWVDVVFVTSAGP